MDVCAHVCLVPAEASRGHHHTLSGTDILWMALSLHAGPLKEQQKLLAAEPFLQSQDPCLKQNKIGDKFKLQMSH